MLECVKSGLRDLFRSRLRAFLTLGGIAVGVLSVVVISSVGLIGKTVINDKLQGMGMDSIIITEKNNRLWEEELTTIKALPAVKNAMPLMNVYTTAALIGTESKCMVWGVNEDAGDVIDLIPLHGRLIDRGDVLSRANVCVIDEQLALSSYGRSNIIGKDITVMIDGAECELEIVGVVQNGVNILQSTLSGIIPSFVYMPYTALREIKSQDYFNEIAVKLSDRENSGSINNEIKRALSFREELPLNLTVENLLKQKDQLSGIMDAVTVVLSLIAGISLIVSGLSVMTVMMMTVKERTREIGIKKSIGAKNSDILTEFLIESVIITLLGGIIGAAIGASAVSLGCVMLGSAVTIDWSMIGISISFSAVTGLIFGAYPAYKAASMLPVEALRSE